MRRDEMTSTFLHACKMVPVACCAGISVKIDRSIVGGSGPIDRAGERVPLSLPGSVCMHGYAKCTCTKPPSKTNQDCKIQYSVCSQVDSNARLCLRKMPKCATTN